MNHIHTILLSFCLAVNTALAQTSPNPVGGTQPTVTTKTDSLSWLIQGPKNAMAVSIAVDQRDHIFLAGFFEDSAAFEKSTLVSGGKVDGFIARYTPAGELQWVRQLRGPQADFAVSLAIDEQGNVYGTGTFQDALQVGDTILKAPKLGAYLVKYAANGDLQWARLIGKGGMDSGKSLALDKSSNVYVTGYVWDVSTMNDVLSHTSKQRRAFVARYDPQGTLLWMNELEGESMGASISTDGQGDIYVGGAFTDTLLLGNTRLVSPHASSEGILRSMGTADGFLAKLNPKGQCQWARRMGGESLDIFKSVAADQEGNVYVGGSFINNKATFDTIPLLSDDQEGKELLNMDDFIAKLDGKGTIQWIVNKVPCGGMSDRCLALGPDGTLYVAGSIRSKDRVVKQIVSTQGNEDIMLTHFSPQGKLLDIRQHGGVDTETARGMYVSPQGDMYMIGGFHKAIPKKDFINYDHSKNRGFFFVKKYPAR